MQCLGKGGKDDLRKIVLISVAAFSAGDGGAATIPLRLFTCKLLREHLSLYLSRRALPCSVMTMDKK